MVATDDRRAWRWAAAMLGLLVIASASYRMHNLDIWLHAATGEWIVEQGEVPLTNVLSELHHDYPSVHDKWGFQVFAHVLLDGLGPDAVNLARILLVALLVFTLAATARGLGASPGATVLCLSMALLVSRNRLVFRPGLVSLVLLALVLHQLLVAHRDGRRLWWLLPLQLLWVNVHGYFLLGWIMALVVAVGHLLAGRRAVAGRCALLGLALAAVAMLNPSGWAGWSHPFAIMADLGEHRDFYTTYIMEFRSIFAVDPRATWFRTAFFAMLAVTIVLLVWEASSALRGRGSAGSDEAVDAPGAATELGLAPVLWPALLLVGMFAVMSISLQRNIAPFAVIAAPVVAAAWTSRLGRRSPGLALPSLLALTLCVGELTNVISLHDGTQRRSGFGASRIAYPDGGIEFIGEHLPDARVFTAFRYGSTFTGKRRPDQRAATNGNTHGYPTQYLRDVISATAGQDPVVFARLSSEHGLTAALLPLGAPLAAKLMRSSRWALVFVGREEAVFVQREAVPPDWLAAHDLERRLAEGLGIEVPPGELSDPRPAWCAAPPPTTRLLVARLMFEGGFPDQASDLAALAADSAPDDPEALGLHGLLLLRQGQRDEGRAVLRRSLNARGFNIMEDTVRQALELADARAGEAAGS
jgi:hypothetical protein